MAMAPKSRKNKARVLRSKVVFRGPVFYVTSDRVREPGGIVVRRDMVRHPGSVVILAVDDSRRPLRVLLARQYRYAARQSLWELPAGRIDHGEAPLAAAKRELLEETGYSARRWKRALFFYSSPGFLDETMAIYLDRKSTRLNSSHSSISYAVFCLKKKNDENVPTPLGYILLSHLLGLYCISDPLLQHAFASFRFRHFNVTVSAALQLHASSTTTTP